MRDLRTQPEMPGGCAWHRSRYLALHTRQLHRHQPSKQEHSWVLQCIAEYQCSLDMLKPITMGDASLLEATAVSPSRYMPSYTEKRFGNRTGNRNNCSSVSRSSIARRGPIHLCTTTQILAPTIMTSTMLALQHCSQETFPRFSPVNSILRSLRRGIFKLIGTSTSSVHYRR